MANSKLTENLYQYYLEHTATFKEAYKIEFDGMDAYTRLEGLINSLSEYEKGVYKNDLEEVFGTAQKAGFYAGLETMKKLFR